MTRFPAGTAARSLLAVTAALALGHLPGVHQAAAQEEQADDADDSEDTAAAQAGPPAPGLTLVTGTAGFVGFHTVRRRIEQVKRDCSKTPRHGDGHNWRDACARVFIGEPISSLHPELRARMANYFVVGQGGGDRGAWPAPEVRYDRYGTPQNLHDEEEDEEGEQTETEKKTETETETDKEENERRLYIDGEKGGGEMKPLSKKRLVYHWPDARGKAYQVPAPPPVSFPYVGIDSVNAYYTTELKWARVKELTELSDSLTAFLYNDVLKPQVRIWGHVPGMAESYAEELEAAGGSVEHALSSTEYAEHANYVGDVSGELLARGRAVVEQWANYEWEMRQREKKGKEASAATAAAMAARLHWRPFHQYHGDVCDADLVGRILAGESGGKRWKGLHIQTVLHLAAQAGVRYSITNPQDYVRNNVECFVELLEVIKDENQRREKHEKRAALDLRGVRLVYASSSSVYGRNTKVPFAESDDVSNPASLYAASKRSNELLATTYGNLYNMHTVGLRFFTVYGAWGRPDMAYFSFMENIFSGTPVQIFHGGQASRDFTFIDDIVDGVERSCRFVWGWRYADKGHLGGTWAADWVQPPEEDAGKGRNLGSVEAAVTNMPGLSRNGKAATKNETAAVEPVTTEVFNLGNSQPVTLLEFISSVEEAAGKPAIRDVIPPGDARSRGDVLQTYADLSKSARLLGYKPRTDLKTGLGVFAKWYKYWTEMGFGVGDSDSDSEKSTALQSNGK